LDKCTFPLNKSFNKHYQKHVVKQKEWENIISQDEYLRKSQKFLNSNFEDKDIDMFISKKGWLFKYNRRTNEFGLGHPEGTISSYFKPKEGINYWYEQLFTYK